ncbi:O-antigen ligase family protein [Xanthobacter aminoxidans]|uniref:O-antigen ligase family protein n=1 Tax=Xanthobacter aminoxidans TaxID=186280 RepID=UPI0037278418
MITPLLAQAVILLYGASAVVLISSPLISAALFIGVRSALQLAAFKGFTLFGVLPIFTLPFLIIAVMAVYTWANSPHKSNNNRIVFYYYIFIAISMVSYLVNISHSGKPIEVISKLLTPTFIYVVIYYGIRNLDDVEKALRYVVYSSVIPIGAGLYQAAIGAGYSFGTDSYVPGLRITGSIVDPNLYGIYLTFILCYCVALVQWGRSSKLMVLYLLLVMATIVLAKNRGTWIAIAGAVMVSVWLFRSRLNIRYWVMGGALVALLAAPVMLTRFQQLNEYDEYGQSQDTFSERLEHHSRLLDMSLGSPLIGFGFESSIISLGNSGLKILPHNDYVRAAVEFGYIAVFFYLVFFFSQMMFCVNNRRSDLWGVQFAGMIMQVYIFIISFSQNLFADILVYSIFFYFLAISHRSGELARPMMQGGAHVQLGSDRLGPAGRGNRLRSQPLRPMRR